MLLKILEGKPEKDTHLLLTRLTLNCAVSLKSLAKYWAVWAPDNMME